MKSNTDQIAAEAAKEALLSLTEIELTSIIKSAIEKAIQVERERADHNADVAESIARASKQTEDALRQQIFELRVAPRKEEPGKHASDPICTCNKENRGAGQHSSHCLAAQSAIKGATSATNVQLAAHASEPEFIQCPSCGWHPVRKSEP